MVHCTGSRRWRKHKPPRIDTVRHWMGMSPDNHFESTAWHITALLKCLFVVEGAESSIQSLVAFVQKFTTVLIHQAAGMVIVEERHQPPMTSLHDRGSHRKHRFGVGITDIIPLSTIQGGVHFLPLIPQPDGSRWYLSNMIDLISSNLF